VFGRSLQFAKDKKNASRRAKSKAQASSVMLLPRFLDMEMVAFDDDLQAKVCRVLLKLVDDAGVVQNDIDGEAEQVTRVYDAGQRCVAPPRSDP